MAEQVTIGVVGCGTISDAYLQAASKFPSIKMFACADIDDSAARSKAGQYKLQAMPVDQLLTHPDVQIILNLTTPQHHVDIGVEALKAGKHTYSEKPLALSVEQAGALVQLSEKLSLRVGCAPDTFLGGAHQTARQAVDEGLIGQAVAGTAFMMCAGHEKWHPNPQFYYQEGGGPLMDMGPYYLTDLVSLLGPVKSVSGAAKTSYETRTIATGERAGEGFAVEVPTHICGILHFVNGAMVSLVMSFDVQKHNHEPIEIYGTEGSLLVGDPNQFERDVQLSRTGQDWEILPQKHAYGDDNYRVLGLVDLAQAIVHDRPHRASLELSLHVLEIMEAILTAARGDSVIHLKHQCERPAAMKSGLSFGQLD